jgi:CheY-like chemotaxis protein
MSPSVAPSSATSDILLVDDDLIQLELLKACLVPLYGAARIATATNGAAAATWLATSQVDPALIVRDVHMPDMDGVEFLSVLEQRGIRCPLLMVSGAHPTVARTAKLLAVAKTLNLVGTLTKPVDLKAFQALVTQAVPVTGP